MLLISLWKRKISILNLLLNGVLATAVFVGSSVLVDSYFWGYRLWPEGQVFWYEHVHKHDSSNKIKFNINKKKVQHNFKQEFRMGYFAFFVVFLLSSAKSYVAECSIDSTVAIV